MIFSSTKGKLMSKTYEGGIGKILDNTSTVLNYVANMPEYEAISDELSVPVMQNLLETCFQLNASEAEARQRYTQAVSDRVAIFKEKPHSIIKILAFIGAGVDAQYQRKSSQSEAVKNLIRKMRGAKLVSKATPENAENSISQAQTSYGSVLFSFRDLIAVIGSFHPTYAPQNPIISLQNLILLKEEATIINANLNIAYLTYKQRLNERNEKLALLHSRAGQIKDSIKSIYGITSYEYKQIVKLKV